MRSLAVQFVVDSPKTRRKTHGNGVAQNFSSLLATTDTVAAVRHKREITAEQPDAFFDVFGHFFTIVPSTILHSRSTVLAVLSMYALLNVSWWLRFLRRKKASGELPQLPALEMCPGLRGVGVYAITVLIGSCANAAFAAGLGDGFKLSMRWFTEPKRAILLYSVIPLCLTLEVLGAVYSRWSKWYYDRSVSTTKWSIEAWFEREIFFGVFGSWTLLYLVGVATHSRIAIIPLLLLMFTGVTRTLGLFVKQWTGDTSTTAVYEAVGGLLGNLALLLVVGPCFTALVDHMVPVFGRTVSPVSPEILLSLFTSLFLFLVAPLTFFCPFVYFLSQAPHSVRRLRVLQWFIVLPLAIAFVLSFPVFTTDIPQRLDAVHFTSRRYSTNGTVVREEHGLTLQTTDVLGVSSTVVAAFAEALAPFRQAARGFPSSSTSFFQSLPFVKKSTEAMSTFDVPADPMQAFYRYPQGNVFRRFASRTLHVIPDLVPPFVEKTEVDRQETEVPALRWYVEGHPFVGGDSPLPYSQRHKKPQAHWRIVSKGTERRIHVEVTGSQRMLLLIPTNQPVIRWSFSKTLPAPRVECDCYAAIFSGGSASPKGFSFYADYDTALRPVGDTVSFTFIVSANYFDIKTPVLDTVLKMERQLAPAVHLMTSTSVGEVGYWEVDVS